MKTIYIILTLLFAAGLSAQDKNFKETKDYLVENVKKYSVSFNNNLKVESVTISESGQIKLIYNKKKDKKNNESYEFNIFNLNKVVLSNDEGKCKCGITLYNDVITFWIKNDEGVGIKVLDSQAKMIYNAFVHLQTLKEKKDPFTGK